MIKCQNTVVTVFCKKGVLWNFRKFIEKHLCQSLFFDKIAGLSPATLLKRRLWHSCFPVNFVKFLRTHFFTEHLWSRLIVYNVVYNHVFYNINHYTKLNTLSWLLIVINGKKTLSKFATYSLILFLGRVLLKNEPTLKHDNNFIRLRSSHWRCSIKKGACNFIKKRGSGTGVFLWILWNF